MIRALFGDEKSRSRSLNDVVEKAKTFCLTFADSDISLITLKRKKYC